MEVDIKNREGGQPPSFSKKPKFKLNKKTIIIGGTIVIIVGLVFMRLMKGSAPAAQNTAAMTYGSEYGTQPPSQGGSDGNAFNDALTALQNNTASAMQNMQTDMLNQMNKNNEDIYKSIADLGNGMTSAMQQMQQQQPDFQNVLQGFATEIGGVLDKQQSSISNLENVFAQSLQYQEERFASLEQSNTDMFNYFTDQISTVMGSIAGITTGVLQPSVKNNTAPLKTGTVSMDNSAIFKSGSFKSQKDAQKIANVISKDYGGTNTKVVKESNGVFRIVSNFVSGTKAESVTNRLIQRNLISTGYVDNTTYKKTPVTKSVPVKTSVKAPAKPVVKTTVRTPVKTTVSKALPTRALTSLSVPRRVI